MTWARKTALTTGIVLAAGLFVLGYNFARHYAIPSSHESVSFDSGDVTLVGTLLKPEGDGPYPAMIVLHGSGRDTIRDPLFRSQARALARAGFAVLLYGKRGVDGSGGDFEAAQYADFIDDAIAAVTYLVSRPDIDANRIGLLGNSESGWFTPEIAYRTNAVAFIVNRVAPSLPWIENVLWEVRNDFLADGIAESDVDALVEITEVSWQYYIDAGRDPSPRDAMRRTVINEELRRLRVNVPGANEVLRRELDDDPATFEWFANNATYDPQPYLERIELPMLYVYGETDINVPTEDCVVFLDWLRDSYGKPIDVVVFDDVGHSMFTWSGLFNAGFVPGYLELLQDWSRAQAGLE